MKEIERKFLVIPGLFEISQQQIIMKQGYLSVDPERIVRIRREGEEAWITIKGKSEGITRPEFEYPVPVEDAEDIFKLVLYQPVEKIRHRVDYEGTHWTVDEFLGANLGLLLAEVELEEETQVFNRPAWLGQEVTDDMRYYSSQLAQNPYSCW